MRHFIAAVFIQSFKGIFGSTIALKDGTSVAGDENYILKVRVDTPAELEELIASVRGVANVSTRTTVVLSTPWE